jgi:CubicO group peptidase (beta-lactamase class C family)
MKKRKSLLIITLAFILVIFPGCSPSPEQLMSIDYAPLSGRDWEVSTPAKEGLDPEMVAQLYYDAAKLNSIYGLLIIKNDKLVAEKYFNDGAINLKSNLQSATKSYMSALVGIAVDRSCLTNLDQPFLDFFPEYADQIEDPHKEEITIRHLLQMRAGYPWEESHPDLWDGLLSGDFLGMMVHYPLISDPGTEFHYSNVSSHFLAAIVARACGEDLRIFAEKKLFSPIGAELGEWYTLDDGYPMGATGMHVTPRDAAKFGLLYLNDGIFNGKQIISSDWVYASLQSYSDDPNDPDLKVGRNFKRVGYGYQWWKIQSGETLYDVALGHGGQQVALLDEHDMVIVLMVYPYFLEHNSRAWGDEKANLNLVSDFIKSLPKE